MQATFLRRLATAAAALAFLAIIAAPVSASEQVPFYAVFEGTVGFTGPSSAAFSGSGIATNLGKSEVQGIAAVLSGPAPGCGTLGGFPARHTDTVTAANGDQLYVVVDDVTCQIEPGIYRGVGTYHITGGTGRFAGATGYGAFEGHGDFNVGKFRMTFSGTVLAQSTP